MELEVISEDQALAMGFRRWQVARAKRKKNTFLRCRFGRFIVAEIINDNPKDNAEEKDRDGAGRE